MMGTCILITGFSMQEAMRELIDFQFKEVQRYDLELTFKDERSVEALWEARRLPGVDYAEPVLNVGCTFVHGPYSRRGGVIGLMPQARLTIPRDKAGRRVRIPSVGLAMSRKLAEALRLNRGDHVTIRPTKGLRQPISAPVVSLVDGYLGLSVYADRQYLNRLIGEESAVTSVQLLVDGAEGSKREMYADLKQLPGVQSIYARADTAANLEETLIKTQSTFIVILVVFAGVIFFGSVLNASLISLAERQTEVGTLRVLGFGSWEVGGLFFRESMLVNLLGTLLGLPAGYYLSQGMSRLYDTELFRIPVVFSWEIVLNTLLLSVLFGAAAHLFVQWTIHGLNWLDSLKVKE